MNKKFFEAIKNGNPEEVQRLLLSTPGLIREKDDGLSPIMVALYRSETAIAEFIAEKSGNLTIFEAAALGKVSQITRQLAHDASLANAYGEDGSQPLGLACYFGHYEAAEYLIKAGASINSPSLKESNAAPIQLAVANRHERIVSLLLDHGADPNVREKNGCTPLHAAAQNNDLPMIRLLLFNGANLTIRSHDGKLPIDFAMEAGHKEAVGLLKEGITRRLRVR
jgi:ankyrin repeat protein